MWKSVFVASLFGCLISAATAQAGIFNFGGRGGCPNGTCGKSSYSGGYAVNESRMTVAANQPAATQDAPAPATAQAATTPRAETPVPQVSSSTRTSATAASYSRGRFLRRWSR